MAILSWLANGSEEIVLLDEEKQRIALSARPLSVMSNVGIDEEVLDRLLGASPLEEEPEAEELLDDDASSEEFDDDEPDA